jgi:hypothetical protein
MDAENEQRLLALAARLDRRDDYGTLLASGYVTRDVTELDDVEQWREAIRRQARQDKLKVTTFISRDGTTVSALRKRQTSERNLRHVIPWLRLVEEAKRLAAGYQHRLGIVIRDGNEGAMCCETCNALIYIALDGGEQIIDGPAVEEDCPNPGFVMPRRPGP